MVKRVGVFSNAKVTQIFIHFKIRIVLCYVFIASSVKICIQNRDIDSFVLNFC